jgi:hypothetical protein
MKPTFPEFRQELVKLLEEDQEEIRNHYKKLKALGPEEERGLLNQQLNEHCHIRAKRMMEIIETIKEPSISNIGQEGSEAVSVLALHSYLDEMKKVLATYEEVYKRNPDDVNKESIPSLTDRIMVLEQKNQLFGNNWMLDKSGKYFLVPVKDFEHMNQRRAKYGLNPRMKPTVYAVGE